MYSNHSQENKTFAERILDSTALDNIGNWISVIMISVLLPMFALLVLMLPFGIYNDATSERISIRKDEWTCTASHQKVRFSGLMISTSTVCDEYRRNS